MSNLQTLSAHIRALAWKGVKRWVRQNFSALPAISTAELAHQLSAASIQQPTLIDARNPDEYALSHLPSAYRGKTVSEVEGAGISKDTPVVVYCSVGYRSGRLAQALAAAGYSVMNLEGSIFQWANEGRDLVTGEGNQARPTCKVHPYNAVWGLLLEPAARNNVAMLRPTESSSGHKV